MSPVAAKSSPYPCWLSRIMPAACLLLAGFGSVDAQQPPQTAEDSSANQRSLLFGPDEVAAVRRALAAQNSTAVPEASTVPEEMKATVSNIFVSGLVNSGDGQWTVWANGYRISSDHQPPSFRVVSVKENDVEIVTGGEQPVRFHLRPYQTWRAAQHDIVDGIVP
jgi:hypothetical protein